ncbi:MAG: HAMP domain-containing histidine kinase [Calothrix sp. SM1_5_4]|nr:HAMP domain-containing histidine kinase [Calothrix sp. SM1_5_4]
MIGKDRMDPATMSRLVDTILSTGKRIERIVRGMKTLAHSGGEDEPCVPTSLREMITDACELCEQRMRNHNIKLEIPEIDQSLYLVCRSHEIVQVLVNLLNNAFDAVVNRTERWVKIEAAPAGDRMEISVTDSGTGIPLEVQAKLFEPFFSTKRVQYGTGLGLSISRSIVEKHQGQLLYDGDRGNTRFVIRLPLPSAKRK